MSNFLYKSNFVLVDSNDRDINKYPTHSSFSFQFGQSNSSSVQFGVPNYKPHVKRKFTEVEYVAIKRVIIPSTNDELPYLLLKIPELGEAIYGSNDIISSSFCYLTNGVSKGNFIIYEFENLNEESDNQAMKVLNPRAEISRLTFELTKPNGDAVVFTDSNANVVIELEINIIKKALDHNNFIFQNS